MQVTINRPQPKQPTFEPFEVTLKVETLEDAALIKMVAMLDVNDLNDEMFKGFYRKNAEFGERFDALTLAIYRVVDCELETRGISLSDDAIKIFQSLQNPQNLGE